MRVYWISNREDWSLSAAVWVHVEDNHEPDVKDRKMLCGVIVNSASNGGKATFVSETTFGKEAPYREHPVCPYCLRAMP